MSFLKSLHATAKPGFCSCGDPLPPKKPGPGRRPKMCRGCQAHYFAIHYAARASQEPERTLRAIRRLEKAAAALVRRATKTLEDSRR